MFIILAAGSSYLIGSIPVGYILSKCLRGIDIRCQGSGNVGATNVFRVIGPIPGIIVLVLDMLKGLIPVTILADFVLHYTANLDPVLVRLMMAVAAVCGHNWTVFLQFKGGKGVATIAGALVGLSLKIPPLGLIAGLSLVVWLVTLLITRYVSLASMVAVCLLPLLTAIFNQPLKLVIFAAALAMFTLFRHKSNIRRLMRGEERKIFSPKKD